MTYMTHENSVDDGAPIELYRFTYGTTAYHYCSGDQDKTYLGQVYTKYPIKRSGTEVTEELQRSSIELIAPRGFPVGEIFLPATVEGVVLVTIFRAHRGTDEYISYFKGRVVSAGIKNSHELSLACEPIFTSLKRPGLRLMYDTICSHGLYDTRCRVLKDLYRTPGSILSIDGLSVVVQEAAAQDNDWFRNGIFECDGVKRHISGHNGAVLRLMHPIPINLVGSPCNIYPGCNHLRDECDAKFNNILNHGAFPWIPIKNPFTGDNVFWG